MKTEINTYQRKSMNKSSISAGLNVVTAFFVAQLMCLPAAAQVSKEVLDSILVPSAFRSIVSMPLR